MRVIFAGTPDFARTALEALHAAGFDIALVLTQPDRPAGRGMKLQASAVKQWALAHDVPVAQPRSLKLEGKFPEDAAAARAAIGAAHADVMVVAAYGLILPQWVLDDMSAAALSGAAAGKHGCLNIHGSLLPRWRGAAPIHRAIEAGDAETGVTIMQMDAGLDTGAMLLRTALPIEASDTTGSLHDKVATLGAQLVVDALRLAAAGGLQPVAQPAEGPASGITYAHKIEKREAQLDWTQAATVLERRIRAFDPFPGAAGQLNGEPVKLWQAGVLTDAFLLAGVQPGQVVAADVHGVDVATGDGVLRLTRLQKPGGKALEAAEFLRGFDIRPGMVFSPASDKA
jgi:methionyl-tRNA formyltransferase